MNREPPPPPPSPPPDPSTLYEEAPQGLDTVPRYLHQEGDFRRESSIASANRKEKKRKEKKRKEKKGKERNCTPYEEEEKSGLCALFLCPRILSHLLLFPRSSLTQGLFLPPRRSSSSPTSPHYVTLSTPVHICRAISRTTAPRSNPLFP